MVIVLESIYIGVDAQYNALPGIMHTPPGAVAWWMWPLGEAVFCAFYTVELLVRF